ncbi:putative cystathionine gamma-synthase [Paraphysoderma sedebokerense]|nr:putative cystathionine gamma-synthase [Paraphysoderma sedebokerense]
MLDLPLGETIPPATPHAVSVSLPKWQDNIDYEEGRERVIKELNSGYPRFVIHQSIKRLNDICLKKFSNAENESCIALPSKRVAEECRNFIRSQLPSFRPPSPDIEIPDSKSFKARIVQFTIQPPTPISQNEGVVTEHEYLYKPVQLTILIFPKIVFPLAKSFWQHSGEIVCSRLAEHCLRILEDVDENYKMATGPSPKDRTQRRAMIPTQQSQNGVAHKTEQLEQSVYLEERFGRNLNLRSGDEAKLLIRKRIAGIIGDCLDESENDMATVRGSDRGVSGVTENDVFLFPCGMSAIYNTHRLLLRIFQKKSVQFGFPYIDTLKILEKFGPGAHFLGQGDDSDLDKLSSLLESLSAESADPSEPPILSVFCEVPSNPLCKTPNLKRLRELANRYGFFLVVDETVGNFVNVGVLQYADVVVSSLTKVFSGDSNVMGGSLILNPSGRFYPKLKEIMTSEYEDLLWTEEAIFLERNSRTFQQRIKIINENTEYLCDYLKTCPKVKEIYYPKYTTQAYYDKLKRSEGGYGGLFSILFHTESQASAFYDNLNVCKGPSLGTNFTLMCPYTILAHYTELEWAKEFGVSKWLVRISVGLEDKEELKKRFEAALSFAEKQP